jgi:SpoVK/Ycf46/Vps4 family AAA+-type ATPase
VDNPKGCGLIGPPGTGKSAAAKAVGAALQIPIIRFDVSRVFGSLVGESEARVTSALNMIDAMAPCVAFVDEVDKAFDMSSGGGDGGTGKRVLGKVLTHMQESDKPIFWIVTANRTSGLPPELLRKGRLDEIWSVTVPSEEERTAIFDIHLRKRNQSWDEIGDKQAVLDASNGYVGAEIEASVKEAVLELYLDDGAEIGELLVAALGNMKPLSEAFGEQFAQMAEWAENNARASSSTGGHRRRRVPAPARSRPRTGTRQVSDEMAG